jgi:hypothetical protein
MAYTSAFASAATLTLQRLLRFGYGVKPYLAAQIAAP